ncbi:MAG TPA: T9SS type A sorting domain-containing protein [Bacteroides sp.]|nr:T9SS type A sorting domain-containing protein [Bacteroides sp.]
MRFSTLQELNYDLPANFNYLEDKIMKKKLLLTGIMTALLLSFTASNAQNVGEKAPDFSYTDLGGTTHTLSQYAGRVVFIYTFGNGCPYCKASGPDTESKVQQVYGSRPDFQALGLDTWDNTSSTATVGAFKSITGITYPLFPKAGSIESLYSTTYDRALVIDQEGILRYKGSKRIETDLDNAIAVIDGLFTSTAVQGIEEGLVEGLAPVYPNPSYNIATVNFSMDSRGKIDIRMYNTIGQEVKKIVSENLQAGDHTREFSVSDLSTGIYFIRMNTSGGSYTRKMQVSR